MDLDDLKKSWKELNEQEIAVQYSSIQQLKNKNSNSPLVKLRKSMFFELILFVVFIIAIGLAYQMDMFNHTSFVRNSLTAYLLVISILYIVFAYRIYQKSKQTFFSESIKEQLAHNIASLKKDVKYYKLYNLLMYVPSVALGFILMNKAIYSFESLNELREVEKIAGLIAMVLLAFPYYLFVNWWIKRLYSKYIHELEQAYKEITQA